MSERSIASREMMRTPDGSGVRVRAEETKRSRTYLVPIMLEDGTAAQAVLNISVQCGVPGSEPGVRDLFDGLTGIVDDELRPKPA